MLVARWDYRHSRLTLISPKGISQLSAWWKWTSIYTSPFIRMSYQRNWDTVSYCKNEARVFVDFDQRFARESTPSWHDLKVPVWQKPFIYSGSKLLGLTFVHTEVCALPLLRIQCGSLWIILQHIHNEVISNQGFSPKENCPWIASLKFNNITEWTILHKIILQKRRELFLNLKQNSCTCRYGYW